MLRVASQLDPFGGLDSVEKFSHHFEEKQRIRVKADGRIGVIRNFNAHHNVNVDLDSGHFVECHPSEIEPADWDSGEQELAGKISKIKGLTAAIAAGAVSEHDMSLIKRACENITSHESLCDPFGLDEGADQRLLKIMCEKYGDTEVLAKRAAEFKVGAEIIEKYTARRGRVVKVGQYALQIDWGGGIIGTILSSHVVAA